MVLAATPNQHSSGVAESKLVAPRTIACNESMALMQCPSVGAIRTDINGPFLLSKCLDIAQAIHDLRRC